MSGLYVLNVILIYVAFKFGMDFYSALYVTILISICQCALNLVMAKKYYGYSIIYFIRDSFIPCLLVAVILCFVLYGMCYMMEPSIWRVIATGIGVGMSLFCGFFVILNKEEKEKVMSFVRKNGTINR